MPTVRRLVVLAFALALVIIGTSAAGLTTAHDAVAIAAAPKHPAPKHRPVRRLQTRPTLGSRAVRLAVRMVGVPYRWGGESPHGFDCSGLVRWAYLHVGVPLPHSSFALFGMGRRVSRSHLKPGDILFFDRLGHVGLYLGRGRMVHAPYTGRNVEVVRLRDWYGPRLEGVRRIVRV